jgi:hypothetical protein
MLCSFCLTELPNIKLCNPDLPLKFHPVAIRVSADVKCSLKLGQRLLGFPGVRAHVGVGADEPFNSDIGALLPIALCGRTSL